MKQPVGFNGSALWAILVALVAGVIWIRNDFGPNFAGAAFLALFGVLLFLAGPLTSIASRQVDGNQRIRELQATANFRSTIFKNVDCRRIFIHRMLLGHFAKLTEDDIQRLFPDS